MWLRGLSRSRPSKAADDQDSDPEGDAAPKSSAPGGAKKEKYSSSYTSVWHLPVTHLQQWLSTISESCFTTIYLTQIGNNRDLLLSYVLLLTGLRPSDKLPSNLGLSLIIWPNCILQWFNLDSRLHSSICQWLKDCSTMILLNQFRLVVTVLHSKPSGWLMIVELF